MGELETGKISRNSVINLNFFIEHSDEILAMKEQVQMIRSFLYA